MSFTVTQLITASYYLSGVLSRQLQTITGDQLTDGLYLLNALLDIKTANSRLIPYFKEYDFTAVIGQEEYFVPNLVIADTLTFNIGPVRYSMSPISRKDYFGSGRIDNIQSLCFNYRFERALGGSNLFVYFLPSQTFPMKLWGKFSLSDVVLNQDLTLTLDKFYIEYLRYGLAEQICMDYNIVMQPQNSNRLKELESIITDISPPDLSVTKISSLNDSPGISWGDINIGKGWRPL